MSSRGIESAQKEQKFTQKWKLRISTFVGFIIRSSRFLCITESGFQKKEMCTTVCNWLQLIATDCNWNCVQLIQI